MKIVRAEIRRINLPLRTPFVIAYNTWTSMPSVIVKLTTDEGVVGWGESVPDEGVTGETIEGVYATLSRVLLPALIGEKASNIEAWHARVGAAINGAYAAKAAIDIALFDILGQVAGQPLYELLGGDTNLVKAPAVIGISLPEQLRESLAPYVSEGYEHFKLKLGGRVDLDTRRVAIAREFLGPEAIIKVDANQGWGSWDMALKAIRAIEPYDIELIEQPVKHHDYEGLRRVREHSPLPIMIDEGVRDLRDLLFIAKQGGMDWVNIKLMKCGGIMPALKMAALAEAAGIKVQIGSMLESSIASFAGAHIHRALAVVRASEMVGPRYFAEDIGNFEYDQGTVVFSPKPGLGVVVDEEKLLYLTVCSKCIT